MRGIRRIGTFFVVLCVGVLCNMAMSVAQSLPSSRPAVVQKAPLVRSAQVKERVPAQTSPTPRAVSSTPTDALKTKPSTPAAQKSGATTDKSKAKNGTQNTQAIGQTNPPQIKDANTRIRALNAQYFIREYWSKGPLIGFLLILFAGFLVSLTPCVYPMIPVTIAVIGASSANEERGRRHGLVLSVMYVLGMAMPYTILGIVIAFIGRQPVVLGASVFTNVYVMGFIVLLFGLMALSMFGLFDLALPSSLQTRLAGYQGKGYFGIFVLGVIGALLATPCSGPVIVGLLAFIAQLSGDPGVSQVTSVALGAALPFVFSIGVGIPFLVLGGGAVHALPRSGLWMTEVKKVFGVIMMGASFYYAYFLMKKHIELFALVLAVTLVGLGIFAGAFRSYEKGGWWWDRLKQVFGLVTLVVGGYLLLSTLMWRGFLVPPVKEILGRSQVRVITIPVAGSSLKAAAPADPCLPPAGYPEDKPFWFKDEKKGMACAKKLKRPVIIDFWAEWCAACLELEAKSFNHPEVAKATRRFVMIKYEYNMTSPEDKRLQKKYTIGSLPLVRFLNSDGQILDEPRIIGFIKHDKVLDLMRNVR